VRFGGHDRREASVVAGAMWKTASISICRREAQAIAVCRSACRPESTGDCVLHARRVLLRSPGVLYHCHVVNACASAGLHLKRNSGSWIIP